MARDAVRRRLSAEGRDRTDRHHFTGSVLPRLQTRDIVRRSAELPVGLRDHLEGAAEIVEIIDILRADIAAAALRTRRSASDRPFSAFRPIDVGKQ